MRNKIIQLLDDWKVNKHKQELMADELMDLFNGSNSVCNCPICGEEMTGIELTHYKCKKCKECFTN